jgi:hypothetical protein
MIEAIVTLALAITLTGCKQEAAPPPAKVEVSPIVETKPIQTKPSCETLPNTKEKLRDGTFPLPLTGKTLVESHLISEEDGISKTSVKSGKQGMDKHLRLSCDILKSKYGVTDCSKVYNTSYSKVWSGLDGHGANLGVPNRYYLEGAAKFKLPLIQEMFMFNLDHINPTSKTTNMPPQGTKYLLCKNKKCVVAVGGIESGPRIAHARMGFTPEVGYFLGVTNPDRATLVGILKDQTTDLGPIQCGE